MNLKFLLSYGLGKKILGRLFEFDELFVLYLASFPGSKIENKWIKLLYQEALSGYEKDICRVITSKSFAEASKLYFNKRFSEGYVDELDYAVSLMIRFGNFSDWFTYRHEISLKKVAIEQMKAKAKTIRDWYRIFIYGNSDKWDNYAIKGLALRNLIRLTKKK